jgi:hypothetical protein
VGPFALTPCACVRVVVLASVGSAFEPVTLPPTLGSMSSGSTTSAVRSSLSDSPTASTVDGQVSDDEFRAMLAGFLEAARKAQPSAPFNLSSYDAAPARADFEAGLPTGMKALAPPERVPEPPPAMPPVPGGAPSRLSGRSDPSASARARVFLRNRWCASVREKLWHSRLRGSARCICAARCAVLAAREARRQGALARRAARDAATARMLQLGWDKQARREAEQEAASSALAQQLHEEEIGASTESVLSGASSVTDESACEAEGSSADERAEPPGASYTVRAAVLGGSGGTDGEPKL